MKALAGKYSRFIRWSDEDNCYIGSLPDFEKDCTHGETLEEVNRNLQEVAEMYIERYLEKGMELPQPRSIAISPSPFRETGNEKSIARLRKSQGMSQKGSQSFHAGQMGTRLAAPLRPFRKIA